MITISNEEFMTGGSVCVLTNYVIVKLVQRELIFLFHLISIPDLVDYMFIVMFCCSWIGLFKVMFVIQSH